MKKLFSLGLIFVLAMSLSLFAQNTIKLKTLGRSPLTQPVTTVAVAKQVVKDHAQEIGKLENDGLFFDLTEQINEAEFKNETLSVGTKIRWMLFRDRNGIVRNVKDIEWAGQEPILAFGFEILHNNMIYRFSIPKICGNICLLEIKKQPEEPVTPPPPPQPQKPAQPEKFVEELKQPEKPKEFEQPKTLAPSTIFAPPQIAPTKKYRPNVKIHAGPWIPWEPMTFSLENQSIDVQYNFCDYLPEYEKFLFCETTENATIYMDKKNFNYETGDSVWLNKQRSAQTSWSGINFNVGLEIRAWKQLWLSIDYYRSRNLHIGVFEYTEKMHFANVEYAGYFAGQKEALNLCPPKYHIYLLSLNRHTKERQTEYTIFSQEIHFVLRYYLSLGRLSLAPSFGVADQQFVKKTNDRTITTVLYPWVDKTILRSERSEIKTEDNNYQLTWTAGLTAELKLHKFVSVAAEGSYRKFPAEQLIHESVIVPELSSNFQSKPWRATAALKILF